MGACGKRPAAGADSETEIGFTTKTGATHRNEAENRVRKLIVRQQVNWSQAPKWSYVPHQCLQRAVGIELLFNFTKSRVFTVLPTASQMNWSQMELSSPVRA